MLLIYELVEAVLFKNVNKILIEVIYIRVIFSLKCEHTECKISIFFIFKDVIEIKVFRCAYKIMQELINLRNKLLGIKSHIINVAGNLRYLKCKNFKHKIYKFLECAFTKVDVNNFCYRFCS